MKFRFRQCVNILLLVSFILLCGGSCALVEKNSSQTLTADTLEEQFRELPIEARRLTGPLFWLHGDKNETKQRLEDYLEIVAAGGNGCFTAESRPHSDWLGPRWYKDLDICLQKAKQLDLKMWIFDERWWPSQSIAGKVPPRYAAKTLIADTVDVTGPKLHRADGFTGDRYIGAVAGLLNEDKEILGDSLVDLAPFINAGKLKWKTPAGNWQIIKFTHKQADGLGQRSGKELSVDGASRDCTDWFIQKVYQPHYDHFKEDFGKTIVGYFYDEPETKGDWGTELNVILKKWGVDWKKAYVAYKFKLAGDDHLAGRYQYMEAIAEAWGRVMYGSMTKWCHEHDVLSIGHFMEHKNLYLRPDYCAGDMMRVQKYSDMGAIDLVCRQMYPGQRPQTIYQTPKLGSSISHVYGKKDDIAMCEIFGAYGQDITYPQMKWLTDQHQVRGINFMIPHSFNPKAPHDTDCPPYFYNGGHESRWPLYRVYADYTSRLSLMLAGGRHVCPVAILFSGNAKRVGKYVTPEDMTTVLQDALYDCDWLPFEAFDAEATVDGKNINLHQERYQVLIVPPTEVIPYATLTKAKKFFDAGGVVLGYGHLPSRSGTVGRSSAEIAELRDAIWTSDVKVSTQVCKTNTAGGRSYFLPEKPDVNMITAVLGKDAGIPPVVEVLEGETDNWLHVLHRVKDSKDIFLICNQDHVSEAKTFRLKVKAKGFPEIWDAMRNEITSVEFNRTGGSVDFNLTLEPAESVLLVFNPKKRDFPAAITADDIRAGQIISVIRQSEPAPSKPKLKPAKRITLSPVKADPFSGKCNVPADVDIGKSRVIIEMDELTPEEAARITINGNYAGGFIGKPFRLDVTRHLKGGENTVKIEPFAPKLVRLVVLEKNDRRTLVAENLRCEYQVEPLGIDVENPRLSWTLKSDVRGQRQTAWQVIVSTSLKDIKADRGNQWDSQKVVSSDSIQVVYQGKPLKSGTRYHWKVRVWDKDGNPSSWSEPAGFETALLNQNDWTAKWINDGKKNPVIDDDFYKFDPAPLFRKDFVLDKPVKQARLYITGLGYYQASINGNRIGDHLLDPGWTDYSKRVYYSTYDITGQLQNSGNCLGVTLGNGWYNPLPLRMWGSRNIRENLPVGRPRLIAQLHITYADGSTQSIVSDEDWKVTEGPILRNSIYLGEIYDGRKEIPGWNKPGFDDSQWSNASYSAEPVGKLQAQPLEPVRVTKTIKPVKITEPVKGVYIVDMGQNFSGLASFKFNLEKGTQVNLRYGELLYEDGTLNPMTSVCGQIKGTPNDSLESHPGVAWQKDVYFAGGNGPETYTPRFTFHAFRYIEITGCPVEPTLDMVTGLRLNSDVKQVGDFSCSNEMLNSIQKMCQWTFLSNIFSVQSDCPHRERFGYGGDLVNTNEAFMYNYDMSNFYAKAVTDWDDAKLKDGMLTDTAPSVGIQYCGVGWAMAHPHTQLKLYQYYGDKRIIAQQYQTSKQWLDLVAKNNPTNIINSGLSDHESLAKKPAPPMVTPLYYQSAKMLAKMADILGIKEDTEKYETLSEKIKTAYNDNFFDADSGKCAPGTQASQSFALFSEIIPKEQRPAALKYLLDDISKHDKHLTTGIFGTRYMLELLSREGFGQTACDIVNQKTFPGWGHMLENGATTLWEHWKYSDNTFSHNHPMFGSVSQWFYNWLGGIQPHPDAIGFDRIIIRPQIPNDLQWVNCSYDSIRGKITSNWRKTDNSLIMDIEIPANTAATVYLPCGKPEAIKENNIPASKALGVKFERCENNASIYNIQSGKYHFVLPIDK